ncbi:MAG: methylmalonyl Co-A mutase-associated GTPase MeaB [SAR202 cluster bacterium]|nr:methylmalonyl Co-A mutase-associated GTPase MeaB [SAR202 cluster bacterium]
MQEVVQRLLAGDQRTLSRLISLVERGEAEAAQVLQALDAHTGRAYTVGITGPPGAGKSTIVDRLTALLRRQGASVGILAADPTSPFSGGALLGDRVRMQRHYLDSQVFIRSVATRGQTGGLPRTVKTLARLLDAAGKDVVLVETVGVGQTELGVLEVADSVLLVLVPESGDAIQTLKAGVMEIADIYAVNKADRPGADQLVSAITATLQLSPNTRGWTPPVVKTEAHRGEGLAELWEQVEAHRRFQTAASLLSQRRQQRRVKEFMEMVEEELGRRWKEQIQREPGMENVLQQVARGDLEPYSAALDMLKTSPLLAGRSEF